MLFKYLDKFEIKNADLTVEILGVFPSGQQRTLQIKDTSYKILMNGIDVDISEKNLALLKNSGRPTYQDIKSITDKLIVEDEKDTRSEIPLSEITIPKKKRGRPAKVK